MAAQRTAELLDVVDSVVLRDGVGGMTVAAVAREAGMLASHVHHYLGSRQQALDAAIDRALDRVEGLLADALEETPADKGLSAQLDVLFSPALDDPRIEQMLAHLVVASYTDEHIRGRMTAMYQRFIEIIDDALARVVPDAPEERRVAVATAVVALADAQPTMTWLRVHPAAREQMRRAADNLIADLDSATG